MRKCASLLILALILLGGIGRCNNNADLVYVRKAYITELGIPPSVSEIEWLMEFKSKTIKESGIDFVIERKYKQKSPKFKFYIKEFYLNSKIDSKLTNEQQETIIKYQAGNLYNNIKWAKNTLVECALRVAENQEDPIDYLFLCLCGRYTNTEESNFFNKIFKKESGTDHENLHCVLEFILLTDTFLKY